MCLVNHLFHDTSPIRIQLTVAWSARSRLFISPDRQTSDPKTSQWNVSTIQIPKHQVSDIFSRYTVIHYQAIFSDTDTKWHINIYIYIYITDYQGYDKIYVYIVESNREIPYNLNQLMWNFDATPMWWFLYWPFTWLPFRSHLFKSTCRFCQTKKLASMPDYALPKILYVHLLLDVHAWFGCKDALPGDCLKKEWR